MLAGTAVYVNAGTQLAAIQSPGDILSPGLLGSFVLLGLFPLLAKAGVAWVQGARCTPGGPSRACSTATWSSSAPAPAAWCRPTSRGRQGQGHADRRPQDGRRLPELRLRAEQGADPLGQDGQAAARRRTSWAWPMGRPVDFAAVMQRVHRVIPTSSRMIRSSATPAWACRCCRAMPASPAPGPWRSRWPTAPRRR
jgi:hypothetical protein